MITRASQAIWRRPWGVHGTGLWTHLPAAQLVVHSGFGLNMYELCPHQCPTALHTAPLPSGRGESYGSHSRILSGTPRETAGCWHRQQTACRAVFPFDSKVTVTALRVSARLPPQEPTPLTLHWCCQCPWRAFTPSPPSCPAVSPGLR